MAMKAARALERRHWTTWGRCASLLPELAALLPPGATRGDKAISAAVDGAKNLATNWAREEVLLDLHTLVDAKEAGEDPASGATRGNIWRKLSKISPGRANAVGPIRRRDGSLACRAEDKAEAPNVHWKEVFAEKHINPTALRAWLDKAIPEGEGVLPSFAPSLPGGYQAGD